MTAHDVLAITLRAIVYYLCKDSTCQNKLQEEISNAVVSGELSNPAQYTEITTLSYLYGASIRVLHC